MGEIQNTSYGVVLGIVLILLTIAFAFIIIYFLTNREYTCYNYAGQITPNCPDICVNFYCDKI